MSKFMITQVSHGLFKGFMVLMIVANTIALAAAYPGMTSTYSNTLNYLNVAFTFIFLAEMLLKVSRWR